MTKKIDPNLSVIKNCVRYLKKSTSPRMLKANIEYLVDRFLVHPPKEEAK